jgi:probable addiction module antidote protein
MSKRPGDRLQPRLIGVSDNDEGVSAYLEAALETSDPAFITQVLGTVACPCGMSQIAKETNFGHPLVEGLKGR